MNALASSAHCPPEGEGPLASPEAGFLVAAWPPSAPTTTRLTTSTSPLGPVRTQKPRKEEDKLVLGATMWS